MFYQERQSNDVELFQEPLLPPKTFRILRTAEEMSFLTATLAASIGGLTFAGGMLTSNYEIAAWGSRAFLGGLTVAGGIAATELIQIIRNRDYAPFQHSYLERPRLTYINLPRQR